MKRSFIVIAIVAAGALPVLTDYPLSSFGASFCFGRCGSPVQGDTEQLSNGTRYTLYADSGWGYKLYRSNSSFNPIWSEVKTAEIANIWELYRPAEIVISPDERFLLVRRKSGLFRLNALGAFWTDLVDIGTEPPRLIIGGGGCCMQEDNARLAANDDMIANIADGLGVVAPENSKP